MKKKERADYEKVYRPKEKVKKDPIEEAVYDKFMHNDKEGTCCLCGAHYENYGHNAQPVARGRCCEKCKDDIVGPARLQKIADGIDWRGTEEEAAQQLVTNKGMKFDPARKLSKQYLHICEETYRKIQKKIPLLWSAMMTKRYVLPQYRQADYYSQEACDYLMLDFIAAFTQGNTMKGIDEVLNTQYVSLVRAIEHGRPTLYMEKDFAPALMKSPLPDDYDISDLHWRWPGFRVYLPKGLITIKRDGQDCSLMFIDIVKVEKERDYELPFPIIQEIRKAWGSYKIPPFRNVYNGLGVSGNLDFDCPESAIAYAGTTPIDTTTIRKVLEYASGSHPLLSPLKSDKLDDEFTTRMMALAIRILLFLSSYEIIPDPPDADLIRKPKMVGDRQLTGLYKAKFVGDAAIRLTESGAKARGITYSENGRTVSPHWVSGHWQRIPYGPKHSLRKLVWIGLYRTGKETQS